MEGRKIRKAFVASSDHFIFSVDYSQVELRILAHVANVDSLLNAFQNNEDIHSVTAMDVFQVDKTQLTQTYEKARQ